jgi:hypothetical protein
MKTNDEIPGLINLPNEDFKSKLSEEINVVKNLILKRMQEVQNEYLKLGYEGSFLEYFIDKRDFQAQPNSDLENLFFKYISINYNLDIFNYNVNLFEEENKNNRMEFILLEVKFLRVLILDIFYLSLVKDEAITDLLKSLKVGKLVTKFFESHDSLLRQLDDHFEKSRFNLPFNVIFASYFSYSSSFFIAQLYANFKQDLIKTFNQLKRKERNNKLSNYEIMVLEYCKNLMPSSDIDEESIKMPISKNSFISDIQKKRQYYYKAIFHNLYMILKEINEDVITSAKTENDFMADFYDLVKILLRDKSILKDDIESQLKYGKPGSRRFKIKRVKSLFIDLSDNYSTTY